MLDVRSINTYRGPAHILHDVSLDVQEGEVVALVGRNGAGKTTILESIMGLLPVRSGHISFLGEDITRLPTHEIVRRGVGFSPEDCGLFPGLTVRDNLQIGQWLAQPARGRSFAGEGSIEDRVFSVFPEVTALIERAAPNLSGGQRKMVAILRAMFLSPSLLLIDEAFEGLAPLVVDRFREAMVMLRELGISLLMAESNLSHAALVADRLYAIDRGELIFEGHPEAALRSEEIMKTLRG